MVAIWREGEGEKGKKSWKEEEGGVVSPPLLFLCLVILFLFIISHFLLFNGVVRVCSSLLKSF